jgi:hypothetical protein
MRSITKVIDNMIELIPNEEEYFIATLRSLKSSAEYTSPETMGLRWHNVAIALCEEFGEDRPTEGWQFEVWKEWMGPNWSDYT